MFIVPNSWGSTLQENNPCHNPPGRGGGQFCSKKAGTPWLMSADEVQALDFESFEAADTALAKVWADVYWRERMGTSQPGDADLLKQIDTIQPAFHDRGQQFKAEFAAKQAKAEAEIKAGRPWNVTADQFVAYHRTGAIPMESYQSYRTRDGIAWLGDRIRYPEDLGTVKGIAYRKEPGARGTTVAFDAKGPVGWASDEFGSVGVWVIDEYQRKGIGVELLSQWLQRNPDQRLGQMTPAGGALARAYHRRVVAEHKR
jgi:GNAT superfamily N-acetyltransferase